MSPGSPSAPELAAVAADDAAPAERPFAIRARDLSKTFRIPHEQRSTVRAYVLHPFRRTRYETQLALADVSFEIADGEFFGIIGRNGSGKSTLLKVLAGIYEPDTGRVDVRGKLSPFIELGVGFNPELSARDNVRINGTLLGLRPREIDERFDEIIAFGELERFVDQKLKNFSSGMQLRLAYSIAIQVPFDILLLDEVLAVGDQNFQEKCFATFEDMRRAGKTVVLVTHDLRAVARFCDRSMLLRDGAVQALGRPEEVAQLYLEQEKERGTGRPVPAARAVADAPATGDGEPDDATREQTIRLLERRWHHLTLEDVGFMSREDIFEALKTQQQYLDERRTRIDRLLEELSELRREAIQLGQMTDVFTRRHHVDHPLPPESLRPGKRSTPVNFLTQGLVDADHVLQVFGETPAELVLEWGCGSGRTARWLASYPDWRSNYRGCDSNDAAVSWVREHLRLTVETLGDRGTLPFADGVFGGAFSLNVLSSLEPRVHRAWHEELRRVLRLGGTAYIAAQGAAMIRGRSDEDQLLDALDREGFAYCATASGATVTFVTRRFIEEVVRDLFALESYVEEGHKFMDAYILRALS